MTARRMHRRSMLASLGSGALALTLAPTLAAQPATPASAAATAIDIAATDTGFAMPARVPAGLVAITLVNDGQAEHAAQLLRHEPDVLPTAIAAAIRQGGIAALASLATFAGGPGHLPPGGSQTVVQELRAGSYVVVCTALDDDGTPHALSVPPHPFAVTGEETATPPPAATAEVRLVDFAFDGLPAAIPAGRHVWKVTNDGAAAHELGLRRLDDGVTPAMLIATLGDAIPAGTPPAGVMQALAGLPVSPAGGIQALAPGRTGWVEIDLDPGDYVAISVVPNAASDGQLDAQLGMIQPLQVTER